MRLLLRHLGHAQVPQGNLPLAVAVDGFAEDSRGFLRGVEAHGGLGVREHLARTLKAMAAKYR
jgi:hypothetical protein